MMDEEKPTRPTDLSARRTVSNEMGPAPAAGEALPETVEVTIDQIRLEDFQLVDIREPNEVAAAPLPRSHLHIPMNDLLNEPTRLKKDQAYLLVCAAGVRTQYTANAFRAAGYDKVYSLIGGDRMVKG